MLINLKMSLLLKVRKTYFILYTQYHQDIYNVLKNDFDVTSGTCPDELIQNHEKYDYVFSLLNKMTFRNSEIFVSALCEYYKLPYLGAAPNIRAIAEDKHIAKLQAEKLHISTSPWIILNYNEKISLPPFDGPYFIKPRYGATSSDIDDSCICYTYEKLNEKIKIFQQKQIDVIIEKYIKGTTCTVGILNNFNNPYTLSVIQEKGKSDYGITTYNEKRKIEFGLNRTILHSKTADKIKDITKNYFNSLKPIDYARFDYIIEESTNEIYFIEFNLCCNLGKASALSIGAGDLSIQYNQLIKNIIYSSMARQGLLDICDIYKF